jgi:hypothetical protein
MNLTIFDEPHGRCTVPANAESVSSMNSAFFVKIFLWKRISSGKACFKNC